MKLQGVIRNLAGHGSITAILLLVLAIAIAGAPQLQQKRTAALRIGTDLAVAKAEAIADALLSHSMAGQSLDMEGSSYQAHQVSAARNPPGATHDPFADSPAVAKFKADPSHPAMVFERKDDYPVLHYAVADGHGGILLIDLSLDREVATIGRYFGQSYLSGSAFGYLLVGLLLFGVFALRLFLRKIAQLPAEERHSIIDAGLNRTSEDRRNLLPWLVALCAGVFFIDLRNWMDSAVGIGYVLAVMLSLSSNRFWHSAAIAGLGTLLMFVAPLLAPANLDWWVYLQNHSVTVFAIIVTGVFGSAHMRKAHAEALALAEATRSRHETIEMRAALARAEAAEAQRRDVSERLNMANQAAGVSVWEWSIRTNQIDIAADSAFSERMGGVTTCDSDEYIAKHVHPDDYSSYRNAFITALNDSSHSNHFAHRYRFCMPDGSIRHIQFHAELVRSSIGKPRGLLGVEWDVTKEVLAANELERQAQQLRDAEARLERASVSSLEGHWEMQLDQPGSKCWFSSSYATLTGYDPAYLATLDADDLIDLTHPADVPAQRAAIFKHLENGTPYDVAIRLQMADGEFRWFQLRGAVERDENGKPVRSAGSIRDIHQQKLSEDLLREAQQRFERAVSGTQDALFDSDLSTGAMWRSPRYYEMLGYEPGELGDARNSVGALIHPDDAAGIGDLAAAHLQFDVPYDLEYRMRHKNGTWIWVRERAKAERDDTGQPIRLAGSIHDITDQRNARDALLRATAEAEAASNAKSTFLATMSHEIRTPMNGVIGMTGLLLDTGLDRVQRDYAETIRASADSLLTILNDILDFSKIEAGKLDIETIDLDLCANVDDVGSIMAFQAAAKGLELVVNVRPEVPNRIMGDPQRIRQCLLNLVGNAIKFTHEGEVVLEVCALGQQNGRSLVHFEVRDTGIGIAPDTIQKLFQPFTQADSSTTRRFGGTGLGLSIVRKLVEMMGGQAGAHSEPGKGSTFWFTLPLEAVVTAEEKAPIANAPLGMRILLVDDNDTNRRVLSSQMIHAGYEVELAATADAALEILHAQAKPFDVVVLDFHMPVMDGAMLGEHIMNSPDIGPTRLVLLTSLDRSGDMQRFADIGFSAYLTKPVRTRELLDCLRKALAIDAQDWHLRSQPIITRGTLIAHETRRQYSGRVLLVEDNAINQRVARRFLERLGCEVEVVSDGAQAVAAFQRQALGFVLMDMQMPVMDGIEATRRIREFEAGRKRTPIVALTANALMGTLERCLEAGMDDYLTKPLDISRLQDVLDRFLASDAGTNTELFEELTRTQRTLTLRGDTTALELDPAVRARLTEIAGDDIDFVIELVNAFVMGSEESIREMHVAIVGRDRIELARAAHKLKGASANLHIDALAALASEVELLARAGMDEGVPRAMEKILAEFSRVSLALRAEMDRQPPRRAANG